MLSTNVLCMKKRKKRSYCLSNASDYGPKCREKRYQSRQQVEQPSQHQEPNRIGMMHITEDTPPDMLAGAMDLTVHLPTGRIVKMSVERCKPMMDVLVLITTQFNLQVSSYTIEALGMAPSQDYSDKILFYRPSTPLGALDTQHIRVVPKQKSVPPVRQPTTGHQPFESTFRLKVHLPKNQLYVFRVSRNIYLEEIMDRVCDDKNLDPKKYEFRHPANLDEVLDPKLTLSDYQITEIYLVIRGTRSTGFSTNDIMTLRREEEKKQMHVKSGGGVFNLIFKRGKNSLGSGSVSSENRSISPTHSDDSRSVTPPAIQPPPVQTEKPKAPQRKRKPAPKPPPPPVPVAAEPRIQNEPPRRPVSEEIIPKPLDSSTTGLTICHSRTSSDSSGYHEASVLSDNVNSSLPRRPKTEDMTAASNSPLKIYSVHSKSMSNLATMSSKSKSTTSLMTTGRKKKVAPAPPPQPATEAPMAQVDEATVASTPIIAEADVVIPEDVVASEAVVELETANPLVASRSIAEPPADVVAVDIEPIEEKPIPIPKPKPRLRLTAAPPVPQPRKTSTEASTSSTLVLNDNGHDEVFETETETVNTNLCEHHDHDINEVENDDRVVMEAINSDLAEAKDSEDCGDADSEGSVTEAAAIDREHNYKLAIDSIGIDLFTNKIHNNNFQLLRSLNTPNHMLELGNSNDDASKLEEAEVTTTYTKKASKFDTLSRKRGFQIGTSLASLESSSSAPSQNADSVSLHSSTASATVADDEFDEMKDINLNIFNGSVASRKKHFSHSRHVKELFGVHDIGGGGSAFDSSQSVSSLDSIPGFRGIKKWNNLNSLDGISLISSDSRVFMHGGGDGSEAESLDMLDSEQSVLQSESNLGSLDNQLDCTDETDFTSKSVAVAIEPVLNDGDGNDEGEAKQQVDCQPTVPPSNETDVTEWKYELPLPPTAFRDSEPAAAATNMDNMTNYDTTMVSEKFRADSVVTSPELFEKLNKIKDNQSDVTETTSMVSEEEKPIFNKLSLESLEKRKSLVYNRELATSLKYPDSETSSWNKSSSDSLSSKKSSVISELESTLQQKQPSTLAREPIIEPPPPQRLTTRSNTSTLPNFKITTYDQSSKRINIWEDDVANSTSDTSLSLKDETFAKPKEMNKYKIRSMARAQESPVIRSGSFSINTWAAVNPIKRSKSQVALYSRQKTDDTEPETPSSLAKATSSIDINGGLQSLGVMKIIQNKLHTDSAMTKPLVAEKPATLSNVSTTSITHITPVASPRQSQFDEDAFNTATSTTTPAPVITTKQYSPPQINMSTWSERTASEDHYNNSTTNFSKSHNNDFNSYNPPASNSNNVSIKVNGSEPISSQSSGNVTIRIGGGTSDTYTPRFQVTTNNIRKPLGTVNNSRRVGLDRAGGRPHTIAFDTNFDPVASRRPVVTSATLKKSITQISTDPFLRSNNNNRPSSVYVTNDQVNFRGIAPATEVDRKSWANFSTTPPSSLESFGTNVNVPFGQARLKRTDSNRLLTEEAAIRKSETMGFGRVIDANGTPRAPPAPPQMPKMSNLFSLPAAPVLMRPSKPVAVQDGREAFLSQIRDFGGKKGLRGVKG